MEVSHCINYLYLVGFVFPFASVIVCWIIFYSMKHYTPGVVLSISETVIPFPESRVFAVTMNIEVWIIVILYIIRNSIVKIAQEKLLISDTYGSFFRRTVMYICTVCVPLGLILVSAITLDEQKGIHLFGAFLFFVGSIIYYISSDFQLRFVQIHVPIYSMMLTWLCLGFAVLYGAFMIPNNQKIKNAGAIFQYITSILIFLKLFVFRFDVPSHHLTVSKDD